MIRSLTFLFLAVFWGCFITSCGQSSATNLIDEINKAKVKARNLGEEGERKQVEARSQSGRPERDGLIEEAAKLYGQVSATLIAAAKNADEMAKVKSPAWYEEYFSLQSKLIRNLAQLAAGAHDEVLARKSAEPTESQIQSWKEHIFRIRTENADS